MADLVVMQVVDYSFAVGSVIPERQEAWPPQIHKCELQVEFNNKDLYNAHNYKCSYIDKEDKAYRLVSRDTYFRRIIKL